MKKNLAKKIILSILAGAILMSGNVVWAADTTNFGGDVNVAGNVQATAFNGVNIVTSQFENQKGSFAIGGGATIEHKYTNGNNANNYNSIAIGTNAKAIAYNNYDETDLSASANRGAIAIGAAALAKNKNAIALGGEASALESATAIGFQTEADHGSIAIGERAVASDGKSGTSTYSVAVGMSAKASGEGSVAIGHSSVATENYVVSVGSDNASTGGDSLKRRIVNVADGVNQNDAVTVGQMNNALTNKVDKATTLEGYGITNAYTKTESDGLLEAKANADNVYTKTETDTKLDAKADKATTLSGYGITDTYTKEQVNDLINGGSAAIAGLNQRLEKTNAKINKVGAGAAALAALHPLDYDPDDKLTFSAGMGNYAGENAAALGAFYRPNEKFMVSLGGTMGNGENMVNLGLSIGLDKPNGFAKMSKRELIQEVNAVKAENEAMKDQLANADERIAKLEALVAQLVAK